ncbi:MAG: hypothetical protein ACYC56_02405 [Candidatus Aquicultor sp.]
MKRYKALIAIIAVSVALALSFGIMVNADRGKAVATEVSRYQKLENLNAGYKERAAESGIPNADQVPILRPGNKGSDKLKPVEKMKGYIPDGDLKDGVYYVTKEMLTFEDFINKYTEFDLDPSIARDRVVNVIVARYPNGYQHRKGFVKNAVRVCVYDAETGDYLGSSIRSLEPGGMGVTRGNPGN